MVLIFPLTTCPNSQAHQLPPSATKLFLQDEDSSLFWCFVSFFSVFRPSIKQTNKQTTSLSIDLVQSHTRIMLSNTAQTPRLHGANITLERVQAPTNVQQRRTKIICTIGPASWSEEGIGQLMDAGANVLRFNFSHGDHEGHGKVLDRVRKVAAEKSRNIAGKFLHNDRIPQQ